MKFKLTIESTGKIKRQEEYDFDISKKDLELANKANYKKPHIFKKGATLYEMFKHEGVLRLYTYVTFYGFKAKEDS